MQSLKTDSSPPRRINWEAQYQKALEAFASNGIIMLWIDAQIESLDEILELNEGSQATFLKLVPLVSRAA